MSEVERIERAAIWHRGLAYSVARPGRHHDVIALMAKRPNHSAGDTHHQGFMTSFERFVDRKEGLKIAEAAGQISKKHGSPKELYSEDMG